MAAADAAGTADSDAPPGAGGDCLVVQAPGDGSSGEGGRDSERGAGGCQEDLEGPEQPRKRARLADAGAAAVMQDVGSSDSDAIRLDSDSPGSDGPGPGSLERGSVNDYDSGSASPAAELEGGGCVGPAGDRRDLVGAGGGLEWPLDSGPGLWEDQEEWGFLGVTLDAETQVEVGALYRRSG